MVEKQISKETVTLLLIMQCFISCHFFSKNEKRQCNNLFLVYMAGDNSLNKTVYADLEEMKQGLSTENDIILVLADRYASNYFEDEWNEARLFQVSYESGNVKLTELEDENIGVSKEWLDDNIDTGSEKTLSTFLQYAASHYDFKKVYLDLWNHGGGWKSGDSYTGITHSLSRNICSDEGSRNSLSLAELVSAINTSKIKHFEIILMDACSMASIEVVAELIGLTDTVIFSQDLVPEDGMPYNTIIPLIFSNKTSCEKCSKICDSYSQSYKNKKTTISAFRIDENDCMKKFLAVFEKYIKLVDDIESIRMARSYCHEFINDVVDIDYVLDDIMKNEYKNVLIQNYSDYSTGLSIFFPEFISYSKDSWEYTTERLRFLSLCPSYLDFLKRIEKNNSSCTVLDSYEPNNFQIDSYVVDQAENKVVSYLWCADDEDWYMLNTVDNNILIKLMNPEFVEYNLLVLLYKGGELIESLYDNENNEVDVALYDFDKLYIKVYSIFGYYSQKKPYSLELIDKGEELFPLSG